MPVLPKATGCLGYIMCVYIYTYAHYIYILCIHIILYRIYIYIYILYTQVHRYIHSMSFVGPPDICLPRSADRLLVVPGGDPRDAGDADAGHGQLGGSIRQIVLVVLHSRRSKCYLVAFTIQTGLFKDSP